MIDRKGFFDAVRASPGGGSLTPGQVDGMSRILNEWEARKLTNLDWLAYMLATVWHESATTMQPIKEYGSEAYLKAKPYYPWYGRGLPMVTWEVNYAKFGCTNPDDMLTWPYALKALFDGMIKGMFTGKKLGDYFSDKLSDPVGARHIINGTDKAALIAGYHASFRKALAASSHEAPKPVDLMPVATTVPKVSSPGPLAAAAPIPVRPWWKRLLNIA